MSYVIASSLKQLRALAPLKAAQNDISVRTLSGNRLIVSCQYVWAIENGQRAMPEKFERVLSKAYSDACGVVISVDELRRLCAGETVQVRVAVMPMQQAGGTPAVRAGGTPAPQSQAAQAVPA